MILCDTSVIVAVINNDDIDHRRCLDVFTSLTERIITTHACLAEAMHLLGNYTAWYGQTKLLEWLESDLLIIHPLLEVEDKRVCELMRQYSDSPMDYADATLVATAETLRLSRILTLDSHFYAYMIDGDRSFTMLPP